MLYFKMQVNLYLYITYLFSDWTEILWTTSTHNPVGPLFVCNIGNMEGLLFLGV
jgi:hypothetical protein